MSLYNMLFGTNPLKDLWFAILGLSETNPDGSLKWPVGRFRDIYLSNDGEMIVLFTRNGGGNREEYEWVFDTLRKHPNYIRDYDDDFDCTYASIEFSVPEKFKDRVKVFCEDQDKRTPMEKFQNLLAKMDAGAEDDPEVKRAREAMKPLIDQIAQAMSLPKEGV